MLLFFRRRQTIELLCCKDERNSGKPWAKLFMERSIDVILEVFLMMFANAFADSRP